MKVMSRKEKRKERHNSGEYYAQLYRDYLNENFPNGCVPEAVQSSDTVTFNIQRGKCKIKFDSGEYFPGVTLEAQIEGGWVESVDGRMKIIRTRKGRVSGRTFEEFYSTIVKSYYKKAYKEAGLTT